MADKGHLTMFLCVYVFLLNLTYTHAIIKTGGVIDKDDTYRKSESPFLVTRNLEIAKGSQLTIEPGVEMRFEPGVKLVVNGTLVAKGTAADRIRFTKNPDLPTGPRSLVPETVRLVEGPSKDRFFPHEIAGPNVFEGRLQFFHKNKWRYVCTNYQEWTQSDANVACHHLGFRSGNYSFNFTADNETLYMHHMAYPSPECIESEDDILNCPGNGGIQIGHDICELQRTIYLRCEDRFFDTFAVNHWHGIEFLNSTSKLMPHSQHVNFFLNVSLSVLEYVDVEYAGVDSVRSPVAAVSASPIPPVFINLHVMNNAFDAMNFSEVNGSVYMVGSKIYNNRGHGMRVKSHLGRVWLEQTDIHDNGGDGVHLRMVQYTYEPWLINDRDTFCRAPVSSTAKTFPVIWHGKPSGYSLRPCFQTVQTLDKRRITVNFLEMDIAPDAEGYLEIRDGRYHDSPLLGNLTIVNGTQYGLPQSVTTNGKYITIKFGWKVPSIGCFSPRSCIKFAIELSSAYDKTHDFHLNQCNIYNNTGRGINVEGMRSLVNIKNSVITGNQYEAGIRIYEGAGDIIINNTIVKNNWNTGVNITYSGGRRIILNSDISENHGYGLFIEHLKLNRTRNETEQKTEIMGVKFHYNEGIAFRVGNYCRSSLTVVNDSSSFIGNWGDAVEFISCLTDGYNANFTMRWVTFRANRGHAFRATPMLNAIGRIWNCTFEQHNLGVIRVDNTDEFIRTRLYQRLPVDYSIIWNQFRNNTGRYVVSLRLTPTSSVQKLDLMFNQFQNNLIEQAFPTLNPRSQASGVIITSSPKIRVRRNNLDMKAGTYKAISTHLMDPSIILDCAENYWGSPADLNDWDSKLGEIFQMIFDRRDRFDLALVNFEPVLKYSNLHTTAITQNNQAKVPTFSRCASDQTQECTGCPPNDVCLLGGELNVPYTTLQGVSYRIDSDINILDNGQFIINAGSTLKFDNSIGILVQGELKTSSSMSSKAVFTKSEEMLFQNNTHVIVQGLEATNQGLLMVQIGDEWGTVCDRGWNIDDAAVVCQMFGLTVDPQDWIVSDPVQGANGDPILLSDVNCGPLDVDVTTCKADSQYEHSCDHSMDVNIKCKPSTWAGIRFTASSRKGELRHAVIEKAGMMDYAQRKYVPAVQIDFNHHVLEDLELRDSISTGLEIIYSDPYANNKIERSLFMNNGASGLLTRSTYLHIRNCSFSHNQRTGFEYNPYILESDAFSVRSRLYETKKITESLETFSVPDYAQYSFLLSTPGLPNEDHTYIVELKNSGITKQITVIVLDYSPSTDIETVIFHNGPKSEIGNLKTWHLEDDLVDFPLVSDTNTLTLEYRVKGQRTGRLAFILLATERRDFAYPQAMIQMYDSMIEYNNRGVQTQHYNSPSNERHELFLRYKDEALHFQNVKIRNNVQEAMYVPSLTKYHEEYLPSIDEVMEVKRLGHINYTIRFSEITNNGLGIVAEHNHVRFSNNFWNWIFTDNYVANNREGGFVIELPKVPDVFYVLNISQDKTKFITLNHTVSVNNTIFEYNTGFEFGILGFFTNVSMINNTFRHNTCKNGLVRLAGMEKFMNITRNLMVDNIGTYVVEIDITSHSEYSQLNDSYFFLNTVQNNQYFVGVSQPTYLNKPESYAVAVRGVQNITLYWNLFENPDLEYELIADMPSSRLRSYLNVTQNWWGASDQRTIEERIFDFDDWSNFAVALYYPYKMSDSFDSPLYEGSLETTVFDVTKPWRGRIDKSILIPYREEPYEVESDVTIMPNVVVTIEPKVKVEFRPSVGILVLGTLIARGTTFDRITFQPKKLDSSSVKRYVRAAPNMRLVGGNNEDEGFVQLFNETSRKWSLICDPNFNEKIAEVMCADLGKDRQNVHVRFTDLYEYQIFGNRLNREKFVWYRSFQCRGTESSLDRCSTLINYHQTECTRQENFAFIRCGKRNLEPEYEYWGNIRFSASDYEQNENNGGISVLQYIDIQGAGILHGEKVAAVEAVYQTPTTVGMKITNCAYNGFDFVAPRAGINIANTEIRNNIGYGVGILGLNGQSGDQLLSSFTPLNESIIPYNVFGLVRMCDAEKDIEVQDRLLLYYKYDYNALDCVKVIRSLVRNKKVAIRFLQMNLYEDKYERNSIEVFDGDHFDHKFRLIELNSNSSQDTKLRRYESSPERAVLSIHLHASPGPGMYGFIAEVVTIPFSPVTYADEIQHVIKGCEITDNTGGSIMYMNVGEINPPVGVRGNIIENNGAAFLNLTSSPNIYMNIQNTRGSTLSNNYITNNNGGIYFHTYASSLSTAHKKNITNNIITYTNNSAALHVQGNQFEHMDVKHNYIAHNYVIYQNSINLVNVSLNFSRNIVNNNTGAHIMDVQGVYEIKDYQWVQYNAIHNNTASGGEHYPTTLYVRNPFLHVHENFLENWENSMELTTHNRSLSEQHYQAFPVMAQNNWWGQAEWWEQPDEFFVTGRIFDMKNDPKYLIPVDFQPFYKTNASVLDGKCRPGWRQYNYRCYLLFGGAVTFSMADDICRSENATLAFGKDRLFNLTLALKEQQGEYRNDVRAWIDHTTTKSGVCSAVRNDELWEGDCNELLPFFCEHDPYGKPPPFDWKVIAIIAGCVGGGLLIMIFFVICWIAKSKRREKQRLERRNSIRSSIRSSRSTIARGSRDHLVNGNNGSYTQPPRALRPPANRYQLGGATLDETNTDTISKSKLPPASTPNSTLDYPSTKHDSTFENELNDTRYPPRLENEIGHISARPHYDMVFENRGYEDSLDQSRSKDSSMRVLPHYNSRIPWKASIETFKTSCSSLEEKPPRSSVSSFSKPALSASLDDLSQGGYKPSYVNLSPNSPVYKPPARLLDSDNSAYENAAFKYPQSDDTTDYENSGTLQLPSRATASLEDDENRSLGSQNNYLETCIDDVDEEPPARHTVTETHDL